MAAARTGNTPEKGVLIMPEFVAIDVTPYPVVLDPEKATPIVIEVAAFEAGEVTGTLLGPDKEPRFLTFKEEEKKNLWRQQLELPSNAAAGTWSVEVGEGEGSLVLEFSVEKAEERDRSEVTVKVDAPRAKYGQLLRFEGTLTVRPTRTLVGEEVTLIFRSSEDLVYEEIAVVRTDEFGQFAIGAPAEASGSWLVRYEGAPDLLESAAAEQKSVRSSRSQAQEVTVANTALPRLYVDWFKATNIGGGEKRLRGDAQPTSAGSTADEDSGQVQFGRNTNKNHAVNMGSKFRRELDSNGGFDREEVVNTTGYWWARVRAGTNPPGTYSGWKRANT